MRLRKAGKRHLNKLKRAQGLAMRDSGAWKAEALKTPGLKEATKGPMYTYITLPAP